VELAYGAALREVWGQLFEEVEGDAVMMDVEDIDGASLEPGDQILHGWLFKAVLFDCVRSGLFHCII